jgi:hypothetical protein
MISPIITFVVLCSQPSAEKRHRCTSVRPRSLRGKLWFCHDIVELNSLDLS